MTLGPGIHTIPADEYHADPCERPSLSASLAKKIVDDSALHAWEAHPRLNPKFKRSDETKFDIGSAAHAMLLEGGDAVKMLPFKDWRKKEAQEARAAAQAEGKLPILAPHWNEIREMVASAHRQLEARRDHPPIFEDGQPEQTLIWEEDGVTCRARPDWLHADLLTVDDYKTTKGSANPHDWTRRTLYDIGADMQAALYLRGLRALRGVEAEFRFIVQETYAPYALSVISLDAASLAIANRKVDYAIATWRECLEKDYWPGYPDAVCVAELPAWEEARWLEREEMAYAYVDPGDTPPF